MEPQRVLVLGATGYVGGRLVPELIAGGLRRALPDPHARRGSARRRGRTDVEVVEGDLSDLASVGAAFDGVDQVVYLVHSLGVGDDFMQQEQVTAHHARRGHRNALVSNTSCTSADSATTPTSCRRICGRATMSATNSRPGPPQ